MKSICTEKLAIHVSGIYLFLFAHRMNRWILIKLLHPTCIISHISLQDPNGSEWSYLLMFIKMYISGDRYSSSW